jgi:integrase
VPRCTVNAALTAYWTDRRARSAKYAVESDRCSIATHVVPTLGETDIADLTKEKLQAWRDSLVKDTDDPELKRRSKATANRVRTTFFAALNLAFENGHVTMTPWLRVPPFKNVDLPRKRSLTVAEAIKVLNACDPDFRQLVRGSLYTGMRLGELRALKAADFVHDRVDVNFAKGGKSRSVPLNAEGARFFEAATAGKAGVDSIFQRTDGPMGTRDQCVAPRKARLQTGWRAGGAFSRFASHLCQSFDQQRHSPGGDSEAARPRRLADDDAWLRLPSRRKGEHRRRKESAVLWVRIEESPDAAPMTTASKQ